MPHPPDDDLIRHGRTLRALARRLVGATNADDVAQDAAVEALRGPTRVGWFGWLTGVVRNRARRHARGDRRRVAREQAVAAEAPRRTETTPLDAAVHRETIARLDAALLALPQPYQDTLLLRYYEDLSPTDIAARTGAPVATVKSRLRRGLAMLREALDRDANGRDWRCAMAAAFGLGDAAPITLAATAAVGGTIMTTKLLAAAAAAGLCAFVLWPRAEAPDAPEPVNAPQVGVAPAAAPGETGRIAGGAERVAAAQPAATSPEPRATRPIVTIAGRVVDEQGAPLPGAEVAVRSFGQGGGSAVARANGASAADGTFAVDVALADDERGYQRVEIRAEGRCPADGSVRDTAAGTRRDLGDIELPIAHRLRGRVVDRAGAPQESVHVQLYQLAVGETVRRALVSSSPARQLRASTDARGEFAIDELESGPYQINLGNRALVDPTQARFELGRAGNVHDLEFVVEAAPPSCRGVVVRSDGTPIEGASVQLDSDTHRTGTDGRFEVTPGPQRGERFLTASANGFHYEGRIAWQYGDPAELRVVLRPLPGLLVRVVDGRTGAAVERFAVHVAEARVWPRRPDVAMDLHPGGIVHVTTQPGERLVLVTPDDDELGRSAFEAVTVPEDGAVDRTITLWPPTERRLVVRDPAGPVAGVAVELLDPGTVTVRPDTVTCTLEDVRFGGLEMARIVQTGTTDDAGALTLRGPKGALALRLSGGGVALRVVQPVRLDVDGDLEVVAERGGIVRGRLVPREVVDELFAAAQAGGNARGEAFGVDVVAEDGEGTRRFDEPPIAVERDGSFVVRGVPPGRRHIALVRGRKVTPLQPVDITPGTAVEATVDVSVFAPITLTLRVLVDGTPAALTYVNTVGWHGENSLGGAIGGGARGRTDDSGVLVLPTYAGRLNLHVYHEVEPGLQTMLETSLTIPKTTPQEHTVDLRLGALDLHVVRPDGQPAADVQVRTAEASVGISGTTDDDGRLTIPVLAAGTYALEVRPSSLTSEEARNAFARANGWKALHSAWLPAGAVTVPPGRKAAPIQLRLPDAWQR